MPAVASTLGTVGGFVEWWLRELAALVPSRVRHLSTRGERIVVSIEAEAIALIHVKTRGEELLARVARGPDVTDRIRAVVLKRGLARALRRRAIDVALRLPPSSAMRSRIELPVAAASNLREVLAFEIDRLTPFRADDVYFAHRVLERDRSAARIGVEVTVVPRPAVAKALAEAAGFGLEPDRIDVAGDEGAPASEPLVVEEQGAPARGGGALNAALGVTALLLAGAAVAIPIAAAQREAAALEAKFAAAKRAAEQAGALRKELAALREEEGFLVDRKRDAPSPTALLLEVTRILPDEAWLTEFEISGSEIRLSGLASSVSALVAQMEESSEFRNTLFRSPVTFDPASGRDRFSIAAQLGKGSRQ